MKFLPWYNEAVISYLETKLQKDFIVFEYGAGNSTLFYAERVNKVCTVETKKEWVDFVLSNGASFNNIEIKLCTFLPNFANEINNFTLKAFDIIVIDSRDRASCLYKSINFLKPKGFILLDNTERPNLIKAQKDIISMGFQKIILEGKREDGTYSFSAIFTKNLI